MPKESENEEIMMINTNKLAMASALSAGLLWVICSAIVVLFPHSTLQMTGHMIHVDLAQTTWTLTWTGFLVGLVGWVALAAITGASLAVIYNSLVGKEGHCD